MPRNLRSRDVTDIPVDPRAGSRHAPTGNPPGAPKKTYLEKRSTTGRRVDELETFGQLSVIPFEQASEAFILLLRETGRHELEYVCKKLLRNKWDPTMVRDRVESSKISGNAFSNGGFFRQND